MKNKLFLISLTALMAAGSLGCNNGNPKPVKIDYEDQGTVIGFDTGKDGKIRAITDRGFNDAGILLVLRKDDSVEIGDSVFIYTIVPAEAGIAYYSEDWDKILPDENDTASDSDDDEEFLVQR